MTGDQKQQRGSRSAVYRAMQTLHLMFFLGGSAIVVGGTVRFAQTVATLRAHGQTIDGDVLRGPFIGISAGLLAAVLGACAFLLLRKGGRWACCVSVVLWAALWFPVVINVSFILPGFAGPILVTMLCIGGSVFATAAYFLLDPARSRPARGERDNMEPESASTGGI